MAGPWEHDAKQNKSDRDKYCMNAVWFHLYVKLKKKKKAKLIKTEWNGGCQRLGVGGMRRCWSKGTNF